MSRRTLMHLVLTGICWAAVVVLTALQMSGWIDWPWVWVLAPLWLPLGLSVASFAGLALFERMKPLKP